MADFRAGRYQVLLVSSTSRQPGHELPPAAVITLKAGEHPDLVLTAPARKGTIRGVVSLAGQPLARATVAVRGRLADGLELPGGWSTETNLADTSNRLGEFTIDNVSPIEWNARVIGIRSSAAQSQVPCTIAMPTNDSRLPVYDGCRIRR